MNNKIITMIAIASGILTLFVLAGILSSYNIAFAKLPTDLTLGVYPNKGVAGHDSHTLGVNVFGALKNEDHEISGATITLTGTGEGTKTVKTDNLGYGFTTHLPVGKHTIEAHFAGDSTHEAASASKTITVTAPPVV